MTTPAQQRGAWAEHRSQIRLEAAGMQIVAYNYLAAFGEIDLIAVDRREKIPSLVFFEVRYRRTMQFGGAAISVTRQKQRKILLTAQDFLQKNPHYQDYAMRFDVLAWSGTPQNPSCEWIESAFDAEMVL